MSGLQRDFVEQIQRGCSLSTELAAAFVTVPREAFVPEGFQRRDGTWAKPDDPDFLPLVYRDDVLVTKLSGRIPVSSSSQPSLMAIMIMALDVRPGMRILEIGAGTGYNAALLASLGATVTSVDVQQDVATRARAALAGAGIAGVRVVHGDGYVGAPGETFDRVIVTVGVGGISPHWLDQVEPGGVVIAPVEHAGTHPVLAVRRGVLGATGSFPAGGPRTQTMPDVVETSSGPSMVAPADAGPESGETADSAAHSSAPAGAEARQTEPGDADQISRHDGELRGFSGAPVGSPVRMDRLPGTNSPFDAALGVDGSVTADGSAGVHAGSGSVVGDDAGARRVTASVVCAAGFMTAAGPLTADYPGAHPAPAQAKTLATFEQVAPPRFDPALDSLSYRNLCYAAGVWSRRASHAAIPGHEQSCLILLDKGRTGGAVILADGAVLAGGAEASHYATEAAAIADRWSTAGRPPMQAWRVTLGPAGDPQAPIWVPQSWRLR